MSANVPVFVYGSLKRGFRHASVIERARRLGPATAEPYALVRYGDYPAMVSALHGVVFGELVLVDEELLLRLDEFEDCPDIYQREQIRLSDGREAFAYVITPERARRCPQIAGGTWTEDGC
jgi:gamma-glutamylcyclotransferase (GGCT)/AIG2-like uncharacterized protein YtfP